MEYLPLFNVIVVPDALPENDAGDGLLPLTLIVKSDGLLVPPPWLITFFVTITFPETTGLIGEVLFSTGVFPSIIPLPLFIGKVLFSTGVFPSIIPWLLFCEKEDDKEDESFFDFADNA